LKPFYPGCPFFRRSYNRLPEGFPLFLPPPQFRGKKNFFLRCRRSLRRVSSAEGKYFHIDMPRRCLLRQNHKDADFVGMAVRLASVLQKVVGRHYGVRDRGPKGRFGRPDEFGDYCAFLCSAHAGFVTGQNLLIDGGKYPGTF